MANDRERRPAHAAGHMAGARRARAASRPSSGGDEISTIGAGQGARVTTRDNASGAARRARGNAEKRYLERHPEARSTVAASRRRGGSVVFLVVASILALAILFVMGSCVMGILFPAEDDGGATPTQTLRPTEQEQQYIDEQAARDSASEQVGVGEAVEYGGRSYALAQQEDGAWGLVLTRSSGTTETLFTVEGTPAALARVGATLIVPENLDGSWDVVCYVIDGHSDASLLVGSDGAAAGGEGQIASIELSGDVLRVTDSAGSTHEFTVA